MKALTCKRVDSYEQLHLVSTLPLAINLAINCVFTLAMIYVSHQVVIKVGRVFKPNGDYGFGTLSAVLLMAVAG
jgi:hypothetical protein